MGMPKSSGASMEAIGGVDEEYELPPEYYDDEAFGTGVRTNSNMGMPKSSGASTETIGGVDEEILMTISTAGPSKGGGLLERPIIEKSTPGCESEFDLRFNRPTPETFYGMETSFQSDR